MAAAISDDVLGSALSRYTRVAALALDQPQGWLADRLRGRVHPGAPDWASRPVQERVDWWVGTVGGFTSALAASPRFLGMISDRFPVQGALAVSSQGLVVCATALEHGVRDPDAWVPLLGRVLFDRDLPPGRGRPLEGTTSRQEAEAGADDLGRASAVPRRGRLRRGAGMLWRLGRTLAGLQSIFDDRPRGPWRWRALGKVPVVGVLGGWLDERGALRKASLETAGLLKPSRR